MNNKAQVFSTDIVIAVIVFIFILITSAWFWDSTKEKIHITEVRNDLELISHNAEAVLINTVGDPPNWHNITFNNDKVFSIGVGKNRPWFIDENKAIRLQELNESNYDLFKRILGVRGASYEFFLNISKYNKTLSSFEEISIVGKKPSNLASHVVNINRLALSDKDKSWIFFNLQVWVLCRGAECY